VKNILFAGVCLAAVQAGSVPSFGQSSAGLSTPSRSELESTIGEMGLSMGEKLSLRKVLQGMQEQGAKVKANDALSDAEKLAQIVQIRKNALKQTQKILTGPQQQQLAALLLPEPASD